MKNTSKQLRTARKQNEQLNERIEQLQMELDASIKIAEGISPVTLQSVPSKKTTEAIAFVIASDWHYEEYVDRKKVNGMNEYTIAIAEERVKQFFRNTVKLLKKEQAQAKIDTLVLALLGDFISSNIHEPLLEVCQLRPIEAMIVVENLIIGGIDYILKNTNVKIILPCHAGNHSRITRKVHIANEMGNSLEYFMYHHMQNYFVKNERVQFVIADGYLSYLTVFDKFTVCFQHGHAVRYQGGIGGLTIPMNKAISQWNKMRTADLYVLGHWHSMQDGGNFIVNGSLIGFNQFAIFIKASFEQPKQTFFLIDKKRNMKTVTTPITFDV